MMYMERGSGVSPGVVVEAPAANVGGWWERVEMAGEGGLGWSLGWREVSLRAIGHVVVSKWRHSPVGPGPASLA